MKKKTIYNILAFVVILLSTPLGYKAPELVFRNRNLTGVYDLLVASFILSLMLIGVLLFILGLVEILKKKE